MHVARAELGDRVERHQEVLVVLELLPDDAPPPRAGSARRATAPPRCPSRSGSPSESSTTRTPRAVEVADRLGVEARPRRRAAASRRRRRARRRARGSRSFSSSISSSSGSYLRAPLVDLGVRAARSGRRRRSTCATRPRSGRSRSGSPRRSAPRRSACRCGRRRGPVATTGTSSRFSARATLIPLPPASVSTWLARWRWPRWKFGTVSVRSSAALSVTVTIIGDHVARHEMVRALRVRVPALRAERARPRDGAARRRAASARPAVPPVEHLRPRRARCPLRTGSSTSIGATTRSTQRPLDADDAQRGLRARRARPCRVPYGSSRASRRCASPSIAPDRAVVREPPGEQRGEVGVPLRARRAAEERRVDRDAAARGPPRPATSRRRPCGPS